MTKVLLDLDFATDLTFRAVFNEFFLDEGLEGDDVRGGFGSGFGAGHVDAAEFAFAQWSADFEVVEGPLAGGISPGEVVLSQKVI